MRYTQEEGRKGWERETKKGEASKMGREHRTKDVLTSGSDDQLRWLWKTEAEKSSRVQGHTWLLKRVSARQKHTVWPKFLC